jgi:uncharacterized membrane protein
MSRTTVQRMVAPIAALLITMTVAPVPAYSAPPGADRGPATALATIRLETRGQIGRLYDVNRSGLVLGALLDGADGTQPVLWRDYRNPIPIDLPPGHSMQLNDRGHIAGIGNDELDLATWLWRPSGVTVLRWPGMLVWMSSLNNRDQIVGSLEHPAGDTPRQPFRWQDGRFTLLEVPAGMHGSANRINNRGDVLGSVANQDRSIQMTVLWRGGRMTELSPPGGGTVHPFDFNDQGQVVGGYTRPDSDVLRPFKWERGRFTDLLPGRPDARGAAQDINESGEIVGFADNRAVLWRGGRMIDLGLEGSANDINDRGEVAGGHYSYVSRTDLAFRAFRWRDGRLIYSAPVIGPEINGGVSIDERGRLIGSISNPGRDSEGLYAWIPTR